MDEKIISLILISFFTSIYLAPRSSERSLKRFFQLKIPIRKKIYLLVILSFFSAIIHAQVALKAQRTISGNSTNSLMDMKPRTDGSYIFVKAPMPKYQLKRLRQTGNGRLLHSKTYRAGSNRTGARKG
jgi:hypothetical protein